MPAQTDSFRNGEERVAASELLRIFDQLRIIDKDMPVQTMLVLFWVALNEGGLQRDMINDLDMPNSSASRNLSALSKTHRLGTPGLNLIEWKKDIMDRRTKRLALTPLGRTVVLGLLPRHATT